MSRATFLTAYVEAALWSSTVGEEGTPMDADYSASDIAPETLERMRADCEDFQTANEALLDQAGDDEQNGHDFWLTRNHHGAGFWDRGYPEAVGRALTDAAHAYGECDLYVGDDGMIYC
jgi:hypothetical protein